MLGLNPEMYSHLIGWQTEWYLSTDTDSVSSTEPTRPVWARP